MEEMTGRSEGSVSSSCLVTAAVPGAAPLFGKSSEKETLTHTGREGNMHARTLAHNARTDKCTCI